MNWTNWAWIPFGAGRWLLLWSLTKKGCGTADWNLARPTTFDIFHQIAYRNTEVGIS